MPVQELRQQALAALQLTDPAEKCRAVAAVAADAAPDPEAVLQPVAPLPGRPPLPPLVDPRQLKQRGLGTLEGRAALIHSLAHIEFNAINLALDIVWRFGGMPAAFYHDWLRVAQEEACHFELLQQHLATLGHVYGDFPAHNGLWQTAEKTAGDLLARLALVPRTLEARGLDVTPAIRAKLVQAGDEAGAAILDIILRDEIGHVSIGNHWFKWLCQQQQLQPASCYLDLASRYRVPLPRAPFNLEARRAAGFEEQELQGFAAESVKS